MNIVSPGSPWWTMTEPLAALAGARRRERAWRMLSGSVKKMATRSRIWNRLRSSSGEPDVGLSLSLTPEGIIGLGSPTPSALFPLPLGGPHFFPLPARRDPTSSLSPSGDPHFSLSPQGRGSGGGLASYPCPFGRPRLLPFLVKGARMQNRAEFRPLVDLAAAGPVV